MKKVTIMYFSPTNTSKIITEAIAKNIAEARDNAVEKINLTKPESRKRKYDFDKDDILVLGYPVYGGRIPKVIINVLNQLSGNGTPAILVAVYGNRDYEDALVECQDILTDSGFEVIAAGAFIGEHSYSEKVGTGRPDRNDFKIASDFSKLIVEKLQKNDFAVPHIKGNRPYKDAMPNMPFKPKTTDACNNCGTCKIICPMQIINKTDPRIVDNGCILCSACVKVCPKHAKYIDAEPILKITKMLETKFTARKEPELFI